MNSILHGDCLEVLRTVAAQSIDLIVTSPPYADKRSHAYGGLPANRYVEWFLPRGEEFKRVLKPSGSFVLNIKESVEDGERQTYVLDLVLALRKQGWLWADEFIWNKTNPFPTGNKNRLKDGFERCHHFVLSRKYKFFPDAVRAKSTSKWAGTNERRKNKGSFNTVNGSEMLMGKRILGDMVRPSNVITTPSSCINIAHPATFPAELPEFFIRLMTEPDDLVLDPFVGSGTTALVAKQLGRRYIGIDRVEEYVNLAKSRLAE